MAWYFKASWKANSKRIRHLKKERKRKADSSFNAEINYKKGKFVKNPVKKKNWSGLWLSLAIATSISLTIGIYLCQ